MRKYDPSVDKILLLKVKKDLDAYDEIVERYQKPLIKNSYRITRDWEESIDIAQQALALGFEHFDHIDPDKSFRGWLFKVTRDLSVDYVRQTETKKRVLQKQVSLQKNLVQYRSANYNRDVFDFLWKCLYALPVLDQTIVTLRFMEGFKLRDISAVVSISEQAIFRRLERAMMKLRNCLSKRGILNP